jgi:hypothetical protein
MRPINRTFTREWAREYDQRYRPRDRDVERRIKAWLRGQPSAKHLDKGHFVRLAAWKAPRSRPAFERNDPTLIRDATSLASRAANERLKVHVLTALEGVNVTVAATILHFMHPRLFPIFDFHAKKRSRRPAGGGSGRMTRVSKRGRSTRRSCASSRAAFVSASATSTRPSTHTTAGARGGRGDEGLRTGDLPYQL